GLTLSTTCCRLGPWIDREGSRSRQCPRSIARRRQGARKDGWPYPERFRRARTRRAATEACRAPWNARSLRLAAAQRPLDLPGYRAGRASPRPGKGGTAQADARTPAPSAVWTGKERER